VVDPDSLLMISCFRRIFMLHMFFKGNVHLHACLHIN
jgi:hypothetical protein